MQPGGLEAPSFREQIVAVTKANQAAMREDTRQATSVILTDFLRDKPSFIAAEELSVQLAPYGLAVSQNTQTQGLLITHVARCQSFPAAELLVNGQPLGSQLEAVRQANWNHPVRQLEIHCRQEAQAARIRDVLSELGVHLQQTATGKEWVLRASYRLDSLDIDELDVTFQGAKQLPGTKVVESSAAAMQRGERALARIQEREAAAEKSQQWER